MSRLLAPSFLPLAAAVVIASTASGYWSAGGTGSAAATAGTLNAPANATAASTPAGVEVAWTASEPDHGTGPAGYYVLRTAEGESAPAPACGSSPTDLITATECSDAPDDGTYTYVVVAKLGSWTAASEPAPELVHDADDADPVVTLTRVNSATATFPLSIADDVETVGGACGTEPGDERALEVTVSGERTASAATTCTDGTWEATLTPALSAEGTYTVTATQSDAAGNTGSSGPRAITVDATPPDVTLTKVNGAAASFPLITRTDVTSVGGACGSAVQDGTTVNLAITGQAAQSATCAGGTWNATLAAPLSAEGSYAVTATQADSAGNEGSSGARAIIVDKTAPFVTLARVNGAAAILPLRTRADVGSVGGSCTSGDGPVSVTVTGAASRSVSAACAAGSWEATFAPLTGEGAYTVTATQTDGAGNIGSSGAQSITIDKTAPAVTLTDVNGVSRSFPLLTRTDVTSLGGACETGADAVTVTITGRSPVTAGCTAGTWSATVSVASDGTVSVSASQQDAAGNTGTSGTRSITVDKTAPAVTIAQKTGQLDPTKVLPIAYTVTFSEPVAGFDASDLTRGGTSSGGTVAVTGSGSSYEISVGGTPADGTITFSIAAGSAEDAAGNANTASTSTDATVTYDTVAPSVTAFASFEANGAGGDGIFEAGDALKLTFDEDMTGAAASPISVAISRSGNGTTMLAVAGITTGSSTGSGGYFAQTGSRSLTSTNGSITLESSGGLTNNVVVVRIGTNVTGNAPAAGQGALAMVFNGGIADRAGNVPNNATTAQTFRLF